MKKLVCLVLTLTLLLTASAMAEYTGSAPVSDEKVTLSILTTNGASRKTDFENMAWWQKVLENANIDLELEIVDSSTYNDVAQPRLAAGQDLPDIMRIPNAESAAASGLFVPLNDLIDQYGYNLNNFFEKYPNLKASLTYSDGNIYFLPYIYTTDSNYRTMLLNNDYLEKLGMTLDDIQTMDDLYDYLVKVRDNDMNGNGDTTDEYPLFLRGATYANCMAIYWGMDVPNTNGFCVDENGQVYCSYLTDEFKEFLQFFNKLYSEGLINQDFLSANWDMQATGYSEQAIGASMDFISNAIDGSQLYTDSFDFYNDVPVYQITALQDNTGKKVVYGRSMKGTNFGITTFCDDVETAFKFLDYMYSEEVGLLTWYGIEGVDYNKNGDAYEFTSVYLDNVDAYRENMGYNMDALCGYQYDYSSTMAPMLGAQTLANAQYTVNPSRLSQFYTEDQQDTLTMYLTDLNTYFSENTTAFMIGTKSFDEWDAYVEGAKTMGVEQVIAVYQEAENK